MAKKRKSDDQEWHGDEPAAEPIVEPTPAHERLRAFEDEVLGEDVHRIDGAPERGHGSKFQQMADHHKAQHAALVALVEAEKQHIEAVERMAKAEEALAAAEERCAACAVANTESAD